MPILAVVSVTPRGSRSVEARAFAMLVDRDRGLMAVLDGPDDVLRAERRVAAEEHAGPRRLKRLAIDDGHVVAIELDAEVALDPRERVLLTDREHDVVARQEHFAQHVLVETISPRASSSYSSSSNRMPTSLPFSMTNSFGE